jgi:hypothetical protein
MEGNFEHRSPDLLASAYSDLDSDPTVNRAIDFARACVGTERVDATVVWDEAVTECGFEEVDARSSYMPITQRYAGSATTALLVGHEARQSGGVGFVHSLEVNVRRLVPLVVLALVTVSCNLGSDHEDAPDDPTDPVTSVSTTVTPDATPPSFDLSCDDIHSIELMLEGDFEGHATPKEAVESWIGQPGIPDGEWVLFEGNKWVLVNEQGEGVALAEVVVMTGNATTTFPTERYVSGGIEYCN